MPSDNYEQFLKSIQDRFDSVTANHKHLFSTDVPNLFEFFLAALPEDIKQLNKCNCCNHFIKQYGNVVAIDESGDVMSAIWDVDNTPEPYKQAVKDIVDLVEKSRIYRVFLSENQVWGYPETVDHFYSGQTWTHLSLKPSPQFVFKPSPIKTRQQAIAEKKEDQKTVKRAIYKFSRDTVTKTLALVKAGTIPQPEKVEGVLNWFNDLQDRVLATENETLRKNWVWLAVAGAPPGFAHINSGIAGTLLEDVAAGYSGDVIKRKFAEKVNPIQYMRPTTVSSGNIDQANAIIQKLQSSKSFERRFAKLEDLKNLWVPAPKKEDTSNDTGMFSFLKPQAEQPQDLASNSKINITFEKFMRKILPEAESIEVFVSGAKQSFSAFVTAADMDAPPVVQWDREDLRNPVTWYTYVSGSYPTTWNVGPNRFHEVTAIVLQPSMWDENGKYDHHGKGAWLIVKGARDTGYQSGAGLFPAHLKSDYHSIRSTVERYINQAKMTGMEESDASGLMVRDNSNYTLRVRSKGVVTTYVVDRWD